VLHGIAVKELDQKELTAAETKFLKEVIRNKGGSGKTVYDGWYPGLFYKSTDDCGKWDAIVADVHTDVPAPITGDPGCVLHQGIGNVNLLMIAVDSGNDRMVFAGPVLSHFEFHTPAFQRMSDSEWRAFLTDGKTPPRSEWTKDYLVPGKNPQAQHYQQQK
jgi:hypothetical protein